MAGLPAEVDVAVVGAGFTGLAAGAGVGPARPAGVVVLDRRNPPPGPAVAMVGSCIPAESTSLDPAGHAPGSGAVGRDRGRLRGPRGDLGELGIDCDWRRSGHLELAGHPRPWGGCEGGRPIVIGEEARVVGSATAGRDRFGAFPGGLLVERGGSVQPARLAAGLAGAAGRPGPMLYEQTEVRAVGRHATGQVVRTRGERCAPERSWSRPTATRERRLGAVVRQAHPADRQLPHRHRAD